MRRVIIIGLAVAANFWLPFSAALAAADSLPDWSERPDEEVYVFGLRLERYSLTEGFIVFFDGNELYLPLGGFAQALEFPISVDPENGTAEGWFLNDDRTFSLDMRTGRVTLEGRSRDLDPLRVERHPDDIYVALSELEVWFPLALDVLFHDLQVVVKPLEPLPLQERIAREERHARLRRTGEDENLERVAPLESWFEWPFVDTSIEVLGQRRNEDRRGQARMTTTVVGVVGGLDGEATAVANSDQDTPNIRMRLGRRSLDGGLLGPLDAREFAFGDVTTPDLPLIAENAVGRGFEVSSFDFNRLGQTNRVTLRGELPVGWEVEVYRNGELIEFQNDRDVGNGRYEFLNLPTLAGLNEFRLVFFGPQGQKREQVERYFVTSELAEPQRTSYRFAFNQRNRDLISMEPQESTRAGEGENRMVFQAEHGVSETFSITGGLASLSVDEQRRTYASAGLQTSLYGALGHLDLAVDNEGGTAVGARTQTQIGSWSVFGEQSWFRNFHSEETDDGATPGHLRSRTAVRINGHLPDFGLGHHPLSASVSHEESEQGDWQTNLFGRVSAIVRPFNFAISSNTRLSERRDTQSDARLLVGTLLGDFRLRGEVGVNLTPKTELDLIALSADWRVFDGFGARVGLRHNGGDSELTAATAGLNRQFEAFALGLSLEADSRGDYNARLGLSFSFGRDPVTDRMEVRAKPFARRGAVSAQVFLDRDNDGVFGPEDEAIESAGFSGPRMRREIVTSDDGTAFVVGIEPYHEVEIGLNEATLEDPFWMAAERPKRVTVRPGTATQLLFPVIETGEIDGMILLRKPMVATGDRIHGDTISDDTDRAGSGSAREWQAGGTPGAGLRVLVIDENGHPVTEAVSAYDGFFFIDRVPYGRYRLTLDAGQVAELGYAAGPARPLVIGRDEPFASGADLFAVSSE